MAERTLLHDRTTSFQGYIRTDGLWEVEASLKDTKASDWMSSDRGFMSSDVPVHHMQIRAAFDDDFIIHEVELRMPSTPYSECQTAIPGLQKLIGRRMSSGWRKAVDECLGGVSGCTHVRELLVNMGTAAFQTVAGERFRQAGLNGNPRLDEVNLPARFSQLNRCIAWNEEGSMIERHFPLLYKKKVPENS